MKSIAVVLRGHVRTWFYNNAAVFNFFESIATNVDYYVVTWEGSCDTNKLEKSFNGKNLKKVLRLENQDFINSWLGPAWQTMHIVPYVFATHKWNPYDAVFDTRPDVIHSMIDGKSFIVPERNTLYTNRFTMHVRDLEVDANVYHLGLADILLMSTPEVYFRLAERFLMNDAVECHSDLKIFSDRLGIDTCLLDWAQSAISRPNAIERIPSCFDFFNNEKNQTSEAALFYDWMIMDKEKRKELLDIHNISLIDY